MGRKKCTDKRDVRVDLRLDLEESDMLEGLCIEHHETQSAVLRRLIREEHRRRLRRAT